MCCVRRYCFLTIGLSREGHDPEYDYILLYNITTDEFNTVPTELGEYNFICLRYDLETNCIQISDYTLTD